MVSPISFSGLASGIDTGKMVEQLVSIEAQPIRRLAKRQDDMRARSKKFEQIRTLLTELSTSLRALDRRDKVITNRVTSQDESGLRVTSSGAAATGRYEVQVTHTAQAQRNVSDGFAHHDQAGIAGSGTLRITVGDGDAIDVTINASDTLEQIVGRINSASAGVQAGLIFDGAQYRVTVTANETGLANAVSFEEISAPPAGPNALRLNLDTGVVQTARDASFSVDGIAMTRSSNTVSSAIPGVTLDLRQDGVSTFVEVTRDSQSLEDKIKSFVDKYNSVHSRINTEFAFAGEAKGPDSLAGDSTLRSIQSRLRTLVTSAESGLPEGHQTLASIGVETNNDGTLRINSERLADAISSDANAVANLFVANQDLGTEGFVKRFRDTVDAFTRSGDGALSVRIKGISQRIRDFDGQIERMERRVQNYEMRLTQQFTAMEQLVSSLQNQGNQMFAMLGG